MSYYTIKPANRAACLSRIELARKIPAAVVWRSEDGQSLGLLDQRRDYVFRSCEPVHDVWDRMVKRGEKYARDVHRGWYTDPDGMTCKDGTGLCWGVVAYLGHGRWLAGHEMGGTDGGPVFERHILDNERDAAYVADDLARVAADQEREYQQRWQGARALEDRIEENRQRLAECLALRNDPRPCFARLRDEARECIDTIRKARAELAANYAGVLS